MGNHWGGLDIPVPRCIEKSMAAVVARMSAAWLTPRRSGQYTAERAPTAVWACSEGYFAPYLSTVYIIWSDGVAIGIIFWPVHQRLAIHKTTVTRTSARWLAMCITTETVYWWPETRRWKAHATQTSVGWFLSKNILWPAHWLLVEYGTMVMQTSGCEPIMNFTLWLVNELSGRYGATAIQTSVCRFVMETTVWPALGDHWRMLRRSGRQS